MKRAVVLLSGGMDSAVTLALAQAEGFECHALSVNYGQRHESELQAAKRVCAMLGAAQHKEVPVDLRSFGGSALTAVIDFPRQTNERECCLCPFCLTASVVTEG